MNKILVEVSVGELLDKISILEIKSEKIKDPEKLNFINDEYKILQDQLNTNIKNYSEIESLYNSLKEINSKLWVIEDDKRLCEKNSDFGVINNIKDISFGSETNKVTIINKKDKVFESEEKNNHIIAQEIIKNTLI